MEFGFSKLADFLLKLRESKLKKVVIESYSLVLDTIIPGLEIFKNLGVEIKEFDYGLRLEQIKLSTANLTKEFKGNEFSLDCQDRNQEV